MTKDKRPDKLEQLYPAGTLLKDCDPEFRGMPLKRYWSLSIGVQCDRSLAKLAKSAYENAPIKGKAIHTSRDNYGMKGVI